MSARVLVILTLSAFVAATPLLAGDDDLAQALALEKQFEKVIAAVEPSIACILVSRNEAYHKACDKKEKVAEDPPAFDKSFDFYRSAGELGRPERVPDKNKRKQFNLADPTIVPEGFGSGVVVDGRKGLILTNFHVVRNAVLVYVRLPGGKGGFADIYAADSRSDLAVLKVNAKITEKIPPVRFGDASKLRRGQFVLSLANPYAAGFRDGQPSASWGILSNIRRRAPMFLREEERVKALHLYSTLLQLDARLNLGCSGGAVLNLQGELVGLTTSYAAIHGGETPGGFAVPFDACFNRIVERLKAGEEIEYGFLGIFPTQDDPANELYASDEGVTVSGTMEGSPAEGKLLSGDRICEVAGVKIRDIDDLFLQLGAQLAGARVQLLVKRRDDRKLRQVEVTLAKMYVPGPRVFSECKTRPFDRHGLRVEYTSMLNRIDVRRKSLPRGVLVDEVKPGSAAARAKLRPGEVIKEVNGRAVTNPASYHEAIKGYGLTELTVTGVEGDNERKIFVGA